MSFQDDIGPITEAVDRLFREVRERSSATPTPGVLDVRLWAKVVDLGLPSLLVSESSGGLGLSWAQAYGVIHVLGKQAVALPVAETILAAKLLADAGVEVPAAVLSITQQAEGSFDGRGFSGWIRGVPFGRDADTVVAQLWVDGRQIVLSLQPRDASERREALNPAGEPRDSFRFIDASAICLAEDAPDRIVTAGALLRCAQIAGALEASLEQSVAYAGERKQFGRAIGQFQTVQQNLALFGTEAAAVACAARAACLAMDTGDPVFAVGAAKLRANLAIGAGTAIAHQVHGAIGFTREYSLRHWTQRLLGWRSEFGNDRYWAERLGAVVASRGPEHFWSDLTARDDRASGAT